MKSRNILFVRAKKTHKIHLSTHENENTMATADPLSSVVAQLNAINTTLAEASSISSTMSSLGAQSWGTLAVIIALMMYQVLFNHGFLNCASSPANIASSVAQSVSVAVTNTIQAHLSSSPSAREPSTAPTLAAAAATVTAAPSQ